MGRLPPYPLLKHPLRPLRGQHKFYMRNLKINAWGVSIIMFLPLHHTSFLHCKLVKLSPSSKSMRVLICCEGRAGHIFQGYLQTFQYIFYNIIHRILYDNESITVFKKIQYMYDTISYYISVLWHNKCGNMFQYNAYMAKIVIFFFVPKEERLISCFVMLSSKRQNI